MWKFTCGLGLFQFSIKLCICNYLQISSKRGIDGGGDGDGGEGGGDDEERKKETNLP